MKYRTKRSSVLESVVEVYRTKRSSVLESVKEVYRTKRSSVLEYTGENIKLYKRSKIFKALSYVVHAHSEERIKN